MEFVQNDWGQCDIINKTKMLSKRGSDKIHDIIQTKYQKYPSIKILKDANVFAKWNKSSYERLINTPSYDAYSIQIHVCTLILDDIHHEQKD